MKFFKVLLLLVFPCAFLPAWDFGLIMDQNASVGGVGNDRDFEYAVSMVPRFSTPVGSNADFTISAGLEVNYLDKWAFVPELLRTELFWRKGSVGLTVGRMYHSDPLGFITEGLFDGAKVSLGTGFGTFSAAAWYTGLLYKKRANIEMTAEEYAANNTALDYGNFIDTYFAPRRLLASVGWEHLSLWGPLAARVDLLGQFGLSGPGKDSIHSQYLAGKANMPLGAFAFAIGACLEFIEAGDFSVAFAGELGASWLPPTRLKDKVSFLGRFSSGVAGGSVSAFLPLTTVSQGSIIEAKLSGLSMLSLDYVLKPVESLGLGITSSYFISSDLGTYSGYPVSGKKSGGHFLGNEFFFRALWSPVSDLHFNLGGGFFLPKLGNAARSADAAWKVELNVVLAVY